MSAPFLTMPIQREDYQKVFGCGHDQFNELFQLLDEASRRLVINASHRLEETRWLIRTLDGQVQDETVVLSSPIKSYRAKSHKVVPV